MNLRVKKLNSLIAEHLAGIFVKDLELPPNVFPSIIKVDTSADLEQTKVFVTAVPKSSRERALHFLQNNAPRIRTFLSKKLVIRRCPRIIFILDTTIDQAERIDQLIDQVHAEKSTPSNTEPTYKESDDSLPHQT